MLIDQRAERDVLLRRRKQAVTQMLYHVSLANQEQLPVAFSLWSHKWKASVTVETKPGGSDCLTATMFRKKEKETTDEVASWPANGVYIMGSRHKLASLHEVSCK